MGIVSWNEWMTVPEQTFENWLEMPYSRLLFFLRSFMMSRLMSRLPRDADDTTVATIVPRSAKPEPW